MICFICGCNHSESKPVFEDDYQGQISFYKNDNNISLLINKDILLILNGDGSGAPNVNYVVTRKDGPVAVKYKTKYELKDEVNILGVRMVISDRIEIILGDNLFCIYDKDIYKDGDFRVCDYIYILNGEKDLKIKLDDRMKVFLYNEYSVFNKQFLEALYTTWVDTYVVSSNTVLRLKFEGDEFNIQTISKKKE